MVLSTAVCAQRTYSWTGAASNQWSNQNNWNPIGVPGTNDSVAFPGGAANLTNTNDLPAGTALAGLSINGGGYTIGGNGMVLTNALGGVGPTAVVDYANSPITKPLTNLTVQHRAADRYSSIQEGNAQSVDHMVVNQALLKQASRVRLGYARINADFGEDNFGDFSVPVRISGHDPMVVYISLP